MNDERESTLNQLLTEMDGFGSNSGVIILAATNRADILDRALLRPGRFDRLIEVPYPDVACREEILRVHVRSVKLGTSVDLSKIARGTPGFSGADLENLINEAALLASKSDCEAIEIIHFESARDKILVGGERKTLIFTEAEKAMTAYHEAGHSLLNLLLPATDPFHKVTIVPRGRTLGVSWSLPERDKTSQTKTELTSRIIVALGGLLAEKLVFNEQTTGVSNDLEKASAIARNMVKSFGMSPLGPIDYETASEHPYLGRDMQNGKSFSEKTSERIDAEVEKIINDCYNQGNKLLVENRDKLNLFAQTLLEKETLHAAEVYELLGITPRETHNLQ
jgi:cell division protease FtsH